ncbi:MAG: hypothetical protein KF868_20870 [Acidobacteria bacterium]|nr:hypothetical protein [Acidobacteriota bacterium]
MTNRVIARLSVIVVLLVTAHALKPISGRSVSTHLLDAIDSFTFVLPGTTSAHLAQANFVAAAFSRSISESGNTREGIWMEPTSASLLAVSQTEPEIATRSERPARKPVARMRIVAKNKPRVKAVELPAAMPIERALAAINRASAEIAMARMSIYSRMRPARFAIRPIPVSMPKPGKRTDCELPTNPPIRTRLADVEVIAAPAEAPMSGPMETMETMEPMETMETSLEASMETESIYDPETIEAAIEMMVPPQPEQR